MLFDTVLGWDNFNLVREEVLALGVLGWTPEIRYKANQVADALVDQRNTAWATLTSTDKNTRQKGFGNVGRNASRTVVLLNELEGLLAD